MEQPLYVERINDDSWVDYIDGFGIPNRLLAKNNLLSVNDASSLDFLKYSSLPK